MRFCKIRFQFTSVVAFCLLVIMMSPDVAADDRGCCVNLVGNLDCDPSDAVDGVDLSTMLDHLFISMGPLCCPEEAKLDDKTEVDGIDLAVLLDHLFISLSPTPLCPDAPSPYGWLTDAGECESHWKSDDDPPMNMGCVEWSYDNGTLSLTHHNAGFNCCPIIDADVWVGSSHIWVEESETFEFEPCPCLCVYDLQFEITNLPPGQYTISVDEIYLIDPARPLSVTIDLMSQQSGIYCEERYDYPWTEM